MIVCVKDIKLFDSNRPELVFEQSSAFELQGENQEDLSIAVNLINSIGVMQGTEGAQKLFEAMRRCVEESEGIAIISCYRKEYVEQYALPQYESTLNVCGQPIWLKPKKYSSENYTLKPKYYQRANSQDLNFEVEVYEKDVLIKPIFMLYRDKEIAQEVIKSGHIRTHTNYESNWYSFNQIANWINKYWDGLKTYHLPTNKSTQKMLKRVNWLFLMQATI